MIEIFTDGACSGNPGPGGFGIILRSGIHIKEISEGYRLTTNNRMELLAIIRALEALKKPSIVTITTDSKYVVDAIQKRWLDGWVNKPNFAGKKNKDLWLLYLEVAKSHIITFNWIKGHNNHIENEKCDKLAVVACRQMTLLVDDIYEAGMA